MIKPKIIIVLLVLVTLGIVFTQIKSNDLMNETKSGDASKKISSEIPKHLLKQFPNTDWSDFDRRLSQALSGGPSKDGIPALDNPAFIQIGESTIHGEVQAIVVERGGQVKAYPYNILVWHEIVNDTVGDTPVAVTFCPLCGSAIVFNRTLANGDVSTFGVSGSLLESNMIMYDRSTESLWQQSTGESLAGSEYGTALTIESFQLQTVGEIRTNYPEAQILSEVTGYRRDYDRNPYAGYDTNNSFVFEPSSIDGRLAPKTIMVVFYANDVPVAVPWLDLKNNGLLKPVINGQLYDLSFTDKNELEIKSNNGALIPFYFEMWFSAASQHSDDLQLLEV